MFFYVKGGEKDQETHRQWEHDHRGSMIVAINEKWGDCWPSWLNIDPKWTINRREKDNFKEITQDILDLFKKAKKIYLRFITHELEVKKSLCGETF